MGELAGRAQAFDSVPPGTVRGEELGRTALSTIHEEITLGRVFTARECHLVSKVKAYCVKADGQCARDLGLTLERGFRTLGSIALALEACPSMRERDTLGQRERSIDTLMKSVLAQGPGALEWTLPTKAVLSRSFGVAKVNFFQALRYALSTSDEASAVELRRRVEDAIEEAVFTRLAEEQYCAFVTSSQIPVEVRRVAMEHLIDLWEGRIRFATYRFCPILRSAWAARARAKRVFGTMMGNAELMQLVFQDCDDRFVSRFDDSDEQSEERIQAFEEFLFDLPFESLCEVRRKMAEDCVGCVDAAQVARYLDKSAEDLAPGFDDPRKLYSSFRRRHMAADYRGLMSAPGPKRTAESIVLEALLYEDLERADADPELP